MVLISVGLAKEEEGRESGVPAGRWGQITHSEEGGAPRDIGSKYPGGIGCESWRDRRLWSSARALNCAL